MAREVMFVTQSADRLLASQMKSQFDRKKKAINQSSTIDF